MKYRRMEVPQWKTLYYTINTYSDYNLESLVIALIGLLSSVYSSLIISTYFNCLRDPLVGFLRRCDLNTWGLGFYVTLPNYV